MPRPRKARVELGIGPTAIKRPDLWEGVTAALREAIVSGNIQAGSNLVEADLAGHFQVSRGPIREALRELAREGLVVDLPRRGTVVSTLTFVDIQEVYEVREGLEVAAAYLAIERATDLELSGLADHVSSMEAAWARRAEYSESLAGDLAFHRDLVALSGNGRLVTAYEQMLSQTQLLGLTAAQLNPRLRLGQKRSAHRNILRALVARDADACRAALGDHYTYARGRLFSGYPRTRQDAEMPNTGPVDLATSS
jgi:GntR family transcriptional regulator of gluconate operon